MGKRACLDRGTEAGLLLCMVAREHRHVATGERCELFPKGWQAGCRRDPCNRQYALEDSSQLRGGQSASATDSAVRHYGEKEAEHFQRRAALSSPEAGVDMGRGRG